MNSPFRRMAKRRRVRKLEFRQLMFNQRGGKRPGAGRKPKGTKPLVSHRARASIVRRHPVLVTMKLRPGLASLRWRKPLAVLNACLRAAGQATDALRTAHFSIPADHLHMILEAESTEALSRGVQGLAVRIARALNRLWARTGAIWSDRFHARVLASPREVRNALVYVLNNSKKHGCHFVGIDPCSSGSTFDGWKNGAASTGPRGARPPMPVAVARSWLLRVGWRRHGLIDLAEIPGGAR